MGLGLRTSLRIEGQAMLVLGGPEGVVCFDGLECAFD